MKEQELVEQFKRGDREAFEQLYQLYQNQAYRTAVFMTGNRADAEDIVQETFVQVYLHIRQLRETSGFRS